MNKVNLVWATPDGENLVAYMARVSNPNNQDNKSTAPKLLNYLISNKHWSPFEMVNVCVEIETTRDIARQILRHRSFSFQEFSQRYAVALPAKPREARMQDEKNRQNSLFNDDIELDYLWEYKQHAVLRTCMDVYEFALKNNIAKEVARSVLPEGLITSKMYMNGTLRSWLHYIDIRCDEATQKEHRLIANQCRDIITNLYPSLKDVL